jgi:ATP phosphoribosyltransferase regulatory subunit
MSISDRDLLPEGLEDRLPREAATTTRVMRAIHGVMHAHGYDRVLPPMIEFDETLAHRMAGIRSRRMFRFVDPQSLRMLMMRGDHTPQISRAASRLAGASRPLRLCYGGQVLLIRGDGLDPAREKLQCGAELIGVDNVAAASEIVALAIEAVQAAGATGVSVDFTLPDLVDVLAEQAFPCRPRRSRAFVANSTPRMPVVSSMPVGPLMCLCSMRPVNSTPRLNRRVRCRGRPCGADCGLARNRGTPRRHGAAHSRSE